MLASLPILRARLHTSRVPGQIWAQAGVTVPLAAGLLPPSPPSGVGLISAWADNETLDAFLEHHALAARLADAWHVRLQPLRASGAWKALPGLGEPKQPVEDHESVAVITLGRLRLQRAAAFMRATRPAERQAVANPALLMGTALARPPHFVATFSLWRTAAAMREYSYCAGVDAAHREAIRAHRSNPFHHESLFARFRPYRASGQWQGLSPLNLSTAKEV